MSETFGSYLRGKIHEWKGQELRRTGREPSQNQFSRYVGISNSMLSMLINDIRKPNQKQLELLSEKLKDPGIYDAAGVARRMPKSRKLYLLAAIWDKLTEEEQDKIYEQAKAITEKQEGDTRSKAA